MTSPNQIEQLLRRAIQAHSQGAPAVCEHECRALLAVRPGLGRARYLLAISLFRQGKFVEAIPILRDLSEAEHWAPSEDGGVDARSVELYLSNALKREGDLAGALRHAQTAAKLAPNDVEVIANLGLCLSSSGNLDQAAVCFEKVIRLAPNLPFGYHGLAEVRNAMGDSLEAIALYRKAAELCPPQVPLLMDIAESLKGLDDSPTAEALANKIHSASPSVRSNVLLASCLSERGKADEALPLAKTAVSMDPESWSAWAVLGTTQLAARNREESNAALLKSLELNPAQGSAWHALVQNGLISEDLVMGMQSALTSNSLNPANLSMLNYSLARSLEKLGRYEESYAAYAEANHAARRHKFGNEPFAREEYVSSVLAPIAAVRETGPLQIGGATSGNPKPIFVFGMIRSGTTLLEQILSLDSKVGAGGEVLFWREYWREALSATYGTLDEGALIGLRERYERVLARICPGKEVVVDKMPLNYELAGLLAMVFPDAPMIHLSRNPLDNCFSIFATVNRSRLAFMHDVEAIGAAYQTYHRAMIGWEQIGLPNTLHVRYEDLVSKQEEWTRKVVEHCGLQWQDEFMHPETNRHLAATPSFVQVQLPVYQSSVSRAMPFERCLPSAWRNLAL